MKTRLLKKLRRRFAIYENSDGYILKDLNKFSWTYEIKSYSLKLCVHERRRLILEEARRKHFKIKRIL